MLILDGKMIVRLRHCFIVHFILCSLGLALISKQALASCSNPRQLIKIQRLLLRHGCLPMFDSVCLLIIGSIPIVCELTTESCCCNNFEKLKQVLNNDYLQSWTTFSLFLATLNVIPAN